MLKRNKDAPLSEELPYWEIFDSPFPHLVLSDGSLVAGFSVGLSDLECFDDSEVNRFTEGIRSTLNSLTEGTSVQFYFTVRSDYSHLIESHAKNLCESAHPVIKSLANERVESLSQEMKEEILYRSQLALFIRTKPEKASSPSFLHSKETFSDKAQQHYALNLETLSQSLDSLSSSLQSLGLATQPLSKDKITKQIYEFLNPKRSKTIPEPQIQHREESDLDSSILREADWLANQSPREQLVFGDLVLGFEQFTLDSHAHRVITLKTLPETTYAGQMASFLRLPFHFDLFLSFEVPPQNGEISKLKQTQRMAHSLSVSHGGKAADLESESKLSSTEDLIRELLTTGQRIFSCQLSLVLRAPNTPEGLKTLNRQVREVLTRFRTLQGSEGLEETVGAWKIVKGSLPGAPIFLERARKMKTNNLADFLPLYGSREGDPNPSVILRNRLNGLVSYDPFSPELPNYNCLVTGSSGAGKSFLNNCILLQELARGSRVFIIDIGGSYKKLTEALDGTYLAIDLSDHYRLNPFDIPNPSEGPSSQKIKSLLAIIENMVSEDDKAHLPKLERVLLEKAILEVYRKAKIHGRVPVLSDLISELTALEEPSLIPIAKMLYMWTGDRPYGRLLDGHGSVKTESPICTFDLKGLSHYPDLQSVMILILTDFILQQVDEDKSRKKRIILDEAWELLKTPASANFMEYCARTLRKTGSGITFITQGIEEIIASPIGSAILNNTATKFVMLQRGSSAALKEQLKLNTQELTLVNSLHQKKGDYSEGFMIEGDHRQVIRVCPTPKEYWLSTSDATDNQYLEGLRDQGLSLIQSLSQAASLYPKGYEKEGTHAQS